MFTKKELLKLFWPVFLEQALATTIGVFNTMMVSGVGPHAISAVSMVDSVNILIMNLYMSLSTGATVVVAQNIGAGNGNQASKAAAQTLTACVATAIFCGAAMIIVNKWIIAFLFPSAEPLVHESAYTYMLFSGISYPFISFFTAASGILRASRNTKAPMMASLLMNVVNVTVCAVTIYGFRMGVAGAGMGLLCARVSGAVVVYWALKHSHDGVQIEKLVQLPTKEVLFPVLKIGVPAAIDSVIFSGGKLLVQSIVAGFGTAAMAANGIIGSFNNFIMIPGNAIVLATTAVIGNTVGSGDRDEVRRQMTRLILYSTVMLAGVVLVAFPFTPLFLSFYSPPPEVMELAAQITRITLVCIPLFWPLSFVGPACLRSTGDAVFVTAVSVISMWLCRVFGAWVLGVQLGAGLVGVWVVWCLDWVFRGAFFFWRIHSRRYERHMTLLEIKTN